MTIAEIITASCRPLGLDFADITADADELLQFLGYVNDAQKGIERRGDWRWLYVSVDRETTPDRDYIEIGADFAAWQSDNRPYFINTGYTQLRYKSNGDFERLRTTAATSGGWPAHYTETFDLDSGEWRMLLYPTPDAVYPIRIPYRRFLLDVTSLDEQPLLPASMHATLKLGAMAEAEEQREKVSRGAQRDKFEQALEADWRLFKTPDRGEDRIHLARAGRDREIPFGGIEFSDNIPVEVDP